MVRRSARILAPLALAGALGCQDYNFNPVGHCLVQPGTKRFTLSSVATADILFVVDDSGSMGGEQKSLATNFNAFVTELTNTNMARVANGLDPIDFHIAITTTSVFLATPVPSASCQTNCNGHVGQNYCCGINLDTSVVIRRCDGGASCGTGFSCRTDCTGHSGEQVCCDSQLRLEPVSCTNPGDPCPDVLHYYNSGGSPTFPSGYIVCTSDADCPAGSGDFCGHCSALTGNVCCKSSTNADIGLNCIPGVATAGAPYPAGDFVSPMVNGKRNPTVLHFDASLYKPTINQTAIDALVAQFKQNVLVGTCGSGQEQGLQAGRLAVQKALAGRQTDYDASGNAIKATWPHSNSKLLVVFVGDEDDCSSPDDPGKVLTLQQLTVPVGAPPGTPTDTCQQDSLLPADQQKEYAISDLAGYLANLGRPLGAGFIVSATGATPSTCVDDACYAGLCCDTVCSAAEGYGSNVCSTDICGGQGPGRRFLAMRDALGNLPTKADVVAGSICDPDFSTILKRLAQIVKPKDTLTLPSQPAAGEVTMLRIIDSNGNTRIPPGACDGPAPVGDLNGAYQRYDWWFIADASGTDRTPTAPSQYIWINHQRGVPCTSDSQCNGGGGYTCRATGCNAPFDTGGAFCCNAAGDAQPMQHCEANPGETYSADYLGMVPAGGCQTAADCVAALGGKDTDWTCEIATGMSRGTCLCANAR